MSLNILIYIIIILPCSSNRWNLSWHSIHPVKMLLANLHTMLEYYIIAHTELKLLGLLFLMCTFLFDINYFDVFLGLSFGI